MNGNGIGGNETFAPRNHLDVGERYISTYGVEMEVCNISRSAKDAEHLVEFAPVNETLRELFWWGVFLGDSHIDSGALFSRE